MSEDCLNKYQQNLLTSSVEKITITKDTEAADSTSQTETIIEPTYVSVIDPFSKEIIELPTHEDDSLTLSTLSHAIPGACGLKYHNAESGTQRALLMDPAGLKFLSPFGGWKGKQFTVIFSQPSHSFERSRYDNLGHGFYRPGDQNAKRRKLMDDDCVSCYDCSDEDGFEGITSTNIKQKRSKNDDDDDDSQTEEATSDLIVLGIPYSNTEEDLRKYFEKFGTVTVSQIKKKEDGQSKGYGFIRMLDYKSQMKVLRSSPLRIDNRTVTVKIPNNSKQNDESGSVIEKPNIRKRLFVSRITEDLTQDILKNFFTKEAKKFNPNNTVTSVFIPRPFRSFAFIAFSNDSCISKIVKKNNYVINGVSVAVEVSNLKEYQISNSQDSIESSKSSKYNDRSLETRIDALNLNQPIKQEFEEGVGKEEEEYPYIY
uniref:TAR DNA-binding protein 43 (inferred by orthology to a human protein) n=1 Tax=Strongyloides venezuelensis TaxID=75913 RepID=A0A0K0F1E5_STRVS